MAQSKVTRAFLKHPHEIQARHDMSLVVYPDRPVQRLIVSGREQSLAWLVCSSCGSGDALVHMGIMLEGRFRVRSACATNYFRQEAAHGIHWRPCLVAL